MAKLSNLVLFLQFWKLKYCFKCWNLLIQVFKQLKRLSRYVSPCLQSSKTHHSSLSVALTESLLFVHDLSELIIFCFIVTCSFLFVSVTKASFLTLRVPSTSFHCCLSLSNGSIQYLKEFDNFAASHPINHYSAYEANQFTDSVVTYAQTSFVLLSLLL